MNRKSKNFKVDLNEIEVIKRQIDILYDYMIDSIVSTKMFEERSRELRSRVFIVELTLFLTLLWILYEKVTRNN